MCLSRLRKRINQCRDYVEEFVSPLKPLVKIIRATLPEIPGLAVRAWKSDARKNIWHGLKQIRKIPKMIGIIAKSKETKEVVTKTLESVSLAAAPAMFFKGVTNPLMESVLPFYIYMPISWCIELLILREAARQLFLFTPLLHFNFPQALLKDLEGALAEDVFHFIKKNFKIEFEGPNVLNRLKEKNILNAAEITYQVVAREIARHFIKVRIDPENVRQAFSGGGKNFFLAKLILQFKSLLSHAEKIEQIISRSIMNKLDAVLPTDELLIKKYAKEVASNLKTVGDAEIKKILECIWDASFKGKSIAPELMPILPSGVFHNAAPSLVETVMTKAMMPFYYLFNARTQGFLFSVNPLLGNLLDAVIVGGLLLDQKFTMVNLNLKEKNVLTYLNIPFCFGLGLGLNGSTKLLTSAIAQLPGGNNWITPFMVYHPMYQLFSMISLLRDDPLPGGWDSLDLFHFNRVEAESAFRLTKETVVPLLQDEKLINKARAFLNSPTFVTLQSLCGGKKVKHLEDVVKIPVVNLFLRLYGRDILDDLSFIDSIKYPRLLGIAKTFLYMLSPIFPTKEASMLITVINHPKTEAAIKTFEKLVLLSELSPEKVLAIQKQSSLFEEIKQWEENYAAKDKNESEEVSEIKELKAVKAVQESLINARDELLAPDFKLLAEGKESKKVLEYKRLAAADHLPDIDADVSENKPKIKEENILGFNTLALVDRGFFSTKKTVSTEPKLKTAFGL